MTEIQRRITISSADALHANDTMTLTGPAGARVIITSTVDSHITAILLDPQALVDALAELFPDVKPSPPKPKVGDRVAGRGHAGIVVDIVGERANVRIEGVDGGATWWRTFRFDTLTVVERAAS